MYVPLEKEMKYKVVKANSIGILEEMVNKYLKDNWSVHEGLVINGAWVYQILWEGEWS